MIGGPPGMAHLVFAGRPAARPGRLAPAPPGWRAHLLPGERTSCPAGPPGHWRSAWPLLAQPHPRSRAQTWYPL